MFARAKLGSTASRTFKRFASSESHHEPTPSKSFEINITKIFAVAAVAGGFLVYKNKDKSEKPFVETELYKFQQTGEREHARNVAYLHKYKESFMKEFIKDKGGIGQRQYRRISDSTPISTTLINSHSTFRNEYGAGIKTNELGPRKERIRLFAPLNN